MPPLLPPLHRQTLRIIHVQLSSLHRRNPTPSGWFLGFEPCIRNTRNHFHHPESPRLLRNTHSLSKIFTKKQQRMDILCLSLLMNYPHKRISGETCVIAYVFPVFDHTFDGLFYFSTSDLSFSILCCFSVNDE